MKRTIALRTLVVAALLGTAGLMAACSSGGPGASTPAGGSAATTSMTAPGAGTGTAGAPAPRATVASTGASIPVNDRPTLVFVDAIW